MATVLIGWELGEGFGHVVPLLGLARALAARGHRPVLALADLVEPRPVLREAPFAVLQAPVYRGAASRARRSLPTASFADVLAQVGLSDAEVLHALAEAWQRLIELTGAALVVADHAPALLVAAHGALPAVAAGIGFAVPPASVPRFPPLSDEAPETASAERVLESVREVQRRRGRRAPEALPALYATAGTLVYAFPELDPYAAYRTGPTGPVEPTVAPSPPPGEPRFFLYAAAEYPGLDEVILGLRRAGVRGAGYIRNAPPVVARLAEDAGIRLEERPPPLADVIPAASLVIHHGGLSTSQAALAAGRPQVLLPRHVEQELTARALERLGCGVALGRHVTRGAVAGAVRRALADRRLLDSAGAVAESLRRRGPPAALGRAVERCCELLA